MSEKEALPFWSRPLSSLPLQDPLILQQETPVKQCVEQMQARKTGLVVVVNDQKEMTGVFSEKDVLVKYLDTPLSGDTPIKEVMTPSALFRTPDTTVAQALDFFGENHIRHLPILDAEHQVVGLLSIRVLTDFIAEHLPESILNLPPKEGVVSQEAAGA